MHYALYGLDGKKWINILVIIFKVNVIPSITYGSDIDNAVLKTVVKFSSFFFFQVVGRGIN